MFLHKLSSGGMVTLVKILNKDNGYLEKQKGVLA